MIALDEDLVVIDQLLSQYPLLDNDTLKALARQARAGDKAARELMVLHNLRLVVSECKPFTNPQTFPDCFQEAIEGLIRAVDKYDPERGNAFSTYAIWWIKQAVRIWLFQKHKVYVPRYMHDAMITVKKYSQSGERNPAAIAEQANMSVDRVMNAQAVLSMHYVSMDAPIQSHKGDLTLADFIEDERDLLAGIEEGSDNHEDVKRLMDLLTPREQQIMRLYYGFDGETMTLAEIAPVLGISRERVRQIYTRAMECMKAGKPTPVVKKAKPVGTCLCGCGEQIETVLDHGGNRKFVSHAHKERYYRRLRKERKEMSA